MKYYTYNDLLNLHSNKVQKSVNYIFNNHSWPDHEYLKQIGNGIIKNEEQNVAQCWILGKKI